MKWVRVFFFFLCAIALYFGATTYHSMFPNFDLWMWIFIPDCPLYIVLLFLIVLFDIKNDFFRYLTGVGLMKYGLWTLMIFVVYSDLFFSAPFFVQTSILFIGHILMAASAFIIVPKKIGLGTIIPVFLWFLLNDFMDYWVGTKPIFPDAYLGLVIPASIGLSILSVCVLYKLRDLRDLEIVEWLRLQLGVSK